jgi:hypothetical protein
MNLWKAVRLEQLDITGFNINWCSHRCERGGVLVVDDARACHVGTKRPHPRSATPA